jgi:hypothetical protein
MAEYVGFSIDFQAPFTRDNLRIFFQTLRAAVEENWERHRDPLSWPGPGGEDIDIEALVEESTPELMRPGLFDNADVRSNDWIIFSFSPVTTYQGLLTMGRNGGRLYACLSVCDSEMRRDDSSRLKLREEHEPGFTDPRFVPSPPNWEDDDYIDQLEETWRENERRYNQFYRDERQLWAVSAECLRNILTRLAECIPVASSRMDDELKAEYQKP